MHDPFFERTVVLVFHHDEDGAIGVVINKAVDFALHEVIELDPNVDPAPYRSSPVGWGGPVETGSGTVITRGEVTEDEGWATAGGLYVTRSQEALQRLLKRGEPLLLCLGYAGWGAGQLDRELEEGGWLFTDVDAQIVMDLPMERRYGAALASLGLSEHMVWMQPISE
jgi:putative transcriptional regulator